MRVTVVTGRQNLSSCGSVAGRWPFPRLRVPSLPPGGSLRQAAGLSSDEVELYHRTYTTLLRSSGETHLRVLEPSHVAMNSSLHPLAGSSEPGSRRVHVLHAAPARPTSGRAA
jgi:hypothetical protein